MYAIDAHRSLWPAFNAQRKLQEEIRAVKLHVDAAPCPETP